MTVIVYFFKLLYILRNKILALKIIYLKTETKYIHGKRIALPNNFTITQFPHFYFDHSDSKLTIHNRISIRGKMSFLFMANGAIEIGEDVFFNSNCSINCMDRVTVGANCLFGENVSIYDHNHLFKDNTVLIKNQGYSKEPITIGSNCWIGSNVTILKGVKIGNNCIIGANSIVHKSIPDDSLVYTDATNQVIKNYL